MAKDLESKIKEKIVEIDKILNGITSIKTIDDEDLKFRKIIDKIKKPHPYIFYILFKNMNYFIQGRNIFQKSLWNVTVQYKSHYFIINEYFFTIQIHADEISSETKEIALDLIEKIINCCVVLDNLLQNHFKEDIKAQKCYINNIYWSVRRIYEFFRDILKEEKKYVSVVEVIKEMKSTESFSFGLILSFFSTCEFILDVFYVFENPKGDFFKFQKKNWYNKFEDVFGGYKIPEIEKIYEKLQEIRGIYRNAYAHGMTYQDKTPNNLLINFEGNPIPVSYQYVADTVYFGRKSLFSQEKADEFISTFEKFFQFIKNKEPFKYYIKWIESGWEIPIYEEWINELLDLFKDQEEFLEYAERRAYEEDRIDNRDFF